MARLISAVLTLAITFGLAPFSAFAQQLPAGYVLVPLSALGSTMPTAGYASAPVTTAEPSTKYSTVRAPDDIGYVGGATLPVTVTLRDASSKAITGRTITLVSSRTSDRITASSATTNANGEATFTLAGREEGVSTLSAVDQTSGITLADRPRIVFLSVKKNVGGNEANLLRASTLAATSSAAKTPAAASSQTIELSFSTKTAKVNEPVSVTARIVGSTGATLTTFTGTITFASATDAAASIPDDHTFTKAERGIHEFSNAVTFTTAGTHHLTATSTDGAMSGEATITVTTGSASADAPIIDLPADNDAIGNTTSISGTAAANSDLAVLIDGEVNARGSSDESGAFAIRLADIADGAHDIEVAVIGADQSVGATSLPTHVTVDATLPELKAFTTSPSGEVAAGQKVTFRATSEPGLASVDVEVEGATIPLLEKDGGIYENNLNADKKGAFRFTVHLTDGAGNTATFPDAGALRVTDKPTPVVDIVSPAATASDKQVTLTWQPTGDGVENIDHYVVRYGTVETELTQTYETKNNLAIATVAGLNNETVYFFDIAGVDAKGVTIATTKTKTAATPRSTLGLTATVCATGVRLNWQPQTDASIVRYVVAYGLSSGSYAEVENVLTGTSHEVKNLMTGTPYFFTVRGLNAAGQVAFAPMDEITATPSGESCGHAAALVEYPIQLTQKKDTAGQLYLEWNPLDDAIAYRIYVGTEPNVYDIGQTTVTLPYFRPTGLPEGKEYYFAVRAIREDGHEAASFSNAVKVKVGPAETLAIAFIIAMIGGYLVWRRRFVESSSRAE